METVTLGDMVKQFRGLSEKRTFYAISFKDMEDALLKFVSVVKERFRYACSKNDQFVAEKLLVKLKKKRLLGCD